MIYFSFERWSRRCKSKWNFTYCFLSGESRLTHRSV